METLAPSFTVRDRCDRCGARAQLRATLANGQGAELLFCAHHGREHHDALVKGDALIDVAP